ncbi:MAG: hypothetical protein NUW01_13495 [Gemmatimonadaceae bacterium]|nr:hypothetical protein [Gemmatimonadaceae bacterium]
MARVLDPNVTSEEKLAKAWFQNDCGDEKCKEHRLAAALLVIRGGKEHVDYAEMVRIIDYSENRRPRSHEKGKSVK